MPQPPFFHVPTALHIFQCFGIQPTIVLSSASTLWVCIGDTDYQFYRQRLEGPEVWVVHREAGNDKADFEPLELQGHFFVTATVFEKETKVCNGFRSLPAAVVALCELMEFC